MQEKLRRLKQERLHTWTPTVAPQNDQKGFIESLCKIVAIFGGNRSGKSEALAVRIALFMQGIHPTLSAGSPPPVYGRFMAPSYEDGCVAVLLTKLKELIPHAWLKGGAWEFAFKASSRTVTFANGSRLRFFSYEQDVNKLGGEDCDFIGLDEHAPEPVFMESLMRLVDRNGWLALSMTPEAGLTWEMDRIVERADADPSVDFFFFSTYDNPHLSVKAIEFVEEQIAGDEAVKARKLFGQFVALAGVVYPQYDDTLQTGNVIPDHVVPEDAPIVCGMDCHHKKPTAILWGYWSKDGQLVLFKEMEFVPTAGGVTDLKQFVRTHSDGRHVSQFIIDESMGGDGVNIYGEHSVMTQLRSGDDGIPFEPTGQKSTEAFQSGIYRVREMLMADPITRRRDILIMQSLTVTRKQFQRYRYRKENKTDEETLREHIANIFDEFPTLARYLSAFNPFLEPEQTEPEVPEAYRHVYSGVRRAG